MNEDFVTYELAVKLKEKGFELRTRYGYIPPMKLIHEAFTDKDWTKINCYAAPTIPQVLKWLRKEKKIHIVIAVNPTFSTKDKIAYYYQVYSNSNGATSDYYESEECYAQWEDCAIGAIKSVLKYLI